jgi:hypothetical protein
MTSASGNSLITNRNEVYTLTRGNGCVFSNTQNANNLTISGNPTTQMWTASGNNSDGWSIAGSANTPNGMPDVTVSTGVGTDQIDIAFS